MHATPSEHNVRLFVYKHFVSELTAPTVYQVAEAFEVDPEPIRTSFDILEKEHVLVLDPDTGEVRMAMPFSAAPTIYRVNIDDASWWAN